jgi:hypothetical protein
MTPGTRVAWRRGPSGGLVIGVVRGKSPRSPERWYSRADGLLDHANAPLQELWECTEERVSDDWPYHPGASWVVPECDFVPLPPGM